MVLCTGTFNIMHAGHVQLLEFAAHYGPVTVGINCDEYQQRKYGEYAVPLKNRAYVLRSCRFVSNVVFFVEDEPSNLIRQLRPTYYIRGPDYAGIDLPESQALYDVGAEVIIHRGTKIHHATALSPALPKFVFDPLDY